MGKLSSYKKLKLENENLKKDIYNLVINSESIEGIATHIRYIMEYKITELALSGSANSDALLMDGIVCQLKTQN